MIRGFLRLDKFNDPNSPEKSRLTKQQKKLKVLLFCLEGNNYFGHFYDTLREIKFGTLKMMTDKL